MEIPSRTMASLTELRAAGYTEREVRRALRSGDLTSVRRGIYATSGVPAEPMARHAMSVRAAARGVASEAVVSHVSAAAMHGLPSWAVPLHRVHVTRGRRHGGRVDRVLHLHVARLAPDEIVIIDGIAVTSVARTVVDCARALAFEPALVVADAALHARTVAPAELMEALRRSARRRGNNGARRVIEFADGRAESVGETRSRVALWRAGIPTPLLQWEIGGNRVDFGWVGRRTVGEFDGKIKYGRLLRPGQDPGEVVFEEKVREDRLRAEGLAVVRWIWRELDDFTPVAARIRRAFDYR